MVLGLQWRDRAGLSPGFRLAVVNIAVKVPRSGGHAKGAWTAQGRQGGMRYSQLAVGHRMLRADGDKS